MTFRKFDAGALHRAGGKLGDCQVRALTTARSIAYPDAWALLYRMQGELKACALTLVESLARNDPRLGVLAKLDFPAVKGKPRMTAVEFVKKHPRGRYILRMAHHVAAVKDGVLFDTFDSSGMCVYTAYEVEEA